VMIADVVNKTCFDVPSVIPEVHPASARFLGFLKDLSLNKSCEFDLRLCFEEALINAVKYGNKEQREKRISVELAYNNTEIFVAIEDQGEGFDPASVSDPTTKSHLEEFSGRGLYLIRHLMDKVQHNEKGNRIEMVKVYQTNSA